MRWSWLLRAGLIATLADCGYASQYAPPADGRARPVWVRDHVENNLVDVAQPPGCFEAIFWAVNPDPPRPPPPPRDDFWTPVAGPVPPGAPHPRFDGGVGAFDEHVELIVAFFVWPALGVVLATWRSESSPPSVDAIDRANAYNDLARASGTPCSWRR